jgi:hypothetical protein
MAQAKKKSIPAKRGTKRGRTRRTRTEPQPRTVDPISPEERAIDTPNQPALPGKDQARNQPLAQLVDITPLNRVRDGYREADVVAVNDAVIGTKRRKKGDLFRIGVIGSGTLPPSVRAA